MGPRSPGARVEPHSGNEVRKLSGIMLIAGDTGLALSASSIEPTCRRATQQSARSASAARRTTSSVEPRPWLSCERQRWVSRYQATRSVSTSVRPTVSAKPSLCFGGIAAPC